MNKKLKEYYETEINWFKNWQTKHLDSYKNPREALDNAVMRLYGATTFCQVAGLVEGVPFEELEADYNEAVNELTAIYEEWA